MNEGDVEIWMGSWVSYFQLSSLEASEALRHVVEFSTCALNFRLRWKPFPYVRVCEDANRLSNDDMSC